MYIPDELVLQLYKMIGEIPAKYAAAPYVTLSKIIVNNEKSKAVKAEGELKDDTDVSTMAE